MIAHASVLDSRVLVLNRAWMPIRAAAVREVLGMLSTGSAKVVEPNTYEVFDFESWAELSASPHEPVIRSAYLRMRVPEVVVLALYDGMPRREVVFTRRNLFRRDHYACQYCGGQPGTSELTIDHVVPKAQGGAGSWLNCVLACVPCNARKANRTPDEAAMKLRRPPFKPKWHPTIFLPLGQRRESWERFLSRAYWNVPLES